MSLLSGASKVEAWPEKRIATFGWSVFSTNTLPRANTDAFCEDWFVAARVVLHQIRTTSIESEHALFERLPVAGIADLGGGDE